MKTTNEKLKEITTWNEWWKRGKKEKLRRKNKIRNEKKEMNKIGEQIKKNEKWIIKQKSKN